tara:strand:+ start:2660 stop:2800 length:141 start_codon:yes stop_codon:yes gene_type:complete
MELLIKSMIKNYSMGYYEAIDYISFNTIGFLSNFENPPLLRYDDEQ